MRNKGQWETRYRISTSCNIHSFAHSFVQKTFVDACRARHWRWERWVKTQSRFSSSRKKSKDVKFSLHPNHTKCPACIFDQNLPFSGDKSGVTGRNSQGNFTGTQRDLSVDSALPQPSLITSGTKHRDQTGKKNEKKVAQRCLKLI